MKKRKKTKRMLAWFLTLIMIFSSLSLNAFAKDTDPDYNHGTIKVEADAVSVQVGDTVNVTVSPYVHVQYRGCGRADCPEICGGLTCFEKGLGCGVIKRLKNGLQM